ncbi:YqeB family protein [Hoyosella subflava]|uniref:YqeB n=1 Tax=Hoyosella subflava (strain DSM 45089 / JCM 17490 / NBRC 109087 / DQS3-9A1) TaxID=443218 RepID=F6ELT0_HOYSD|nr:hypothetical protein [Hoyosella subflava]AEF41528.1 YqeB [Hoyosella subflava DQS3-9A1]
MNMKASAHGPETELGLSFPIRLLLFIGSPLAGAAVGYSLPRVAEWALNLPWIPMRGPLELVSSFDQRWSILAFLVAGFLLGVVFAVIAVVGCLTITVNNHDVTLAKDGDSRTISRSDISAAFVDGRNLVLLDRESRQVCRDPHESTVAELADAFRKHGYPWCDQDPHADLYRRWIPAAPELPAGVNALLKAREEALRKKVAEDVTELRGEVERLGYTVREEGTKQYWRPLVGS